MEEKIEVLGIKMDCLSAKEEMLLAMQFMENDSVDTIEIMTMDVLMNSGEDADWKSGVEGLRLVIPGEAEILEAADIHDRMRLKETRDRVFLKMFMKYLQKNRKRVYLLGETEEGLAGVENVIRKYNRGIRITGHALLSPENRREEEVINDINGAETDCIISVLASPYQEEFISRNKTLLNVKVWLGCGTILERSYDGHRLLRRIRHFFRKTMFQREVEKQQKEK